MNKLMKSLCGTLWIALMCQSCDSAESYDPPIDLQKSCVVERIGDALYVSSKLDESNDIVYVFEKCMFNKLYTFRRWELLRIVRVSRSLTLKMLQV